MLPRNQYPPAYDHKLDRSDVKKLYNGILQTFVDKDLTKVLYFAGFENYENKIQPDAFDDRLFALITYLERVGQLHWLLSIVLEERAGFPDFILLRTRWVPPLPPAVGAPAPPPAAPAPVPPGNGAGAAPSSSADVWNLVLLDTGRPFLDRSALRAECRRVVMGAKPILSVTGDPDTGKSYSSRYLVGVAKSLSDEQNAFVTREIALDSFNGVVATGAPADISGLRLAQRLAQVITDQDLPKYVVSTVGSEQDIAWAADAADWILRNAKDKPLRWIVFDGFETTVLSPSAQALLNSLLAGVARDAKIRIALLGYPGDLSWVAASVQPVTLDLVEFTDRVNLTDHVINYLLEVRRAAVERGRPAFTDEQFKEDVRRVLAGFDPGAPDLAVLDTALTAVAQRVLAGA
jgi:hypothetical protein